MDLLQAYLQRKMLDDQLSQQTSQADANRQARAQELQATLQQQQWQQQQQHELERGRWGNQRELKRMELDELGPKFNRELQLAMLKQQLENEGRLGAAEIMYGNRKMKPDPRIFEQFAMAYRQANPKARPGDAEDYAWAKMMGGQQGQPGMGPQPMSAPPPQKQTPFQGASIPGIGGMAFPGAGATVNDVAQGVGQSMLRNPPNLWGALAPPGSPLGPWAQLYGAMR